MLLADLALGVSIFFVFLTFVFSLWTLCKLMHKRTDVSAVLRRSLILICCAFMLWCIAEVAQFVLEFLGVRVVENLADVPWILGYFLILSGFIYWLSFLYKKHDINPFIPIVGVLFSGCAVGYLVARMFIVDNWSFVYFVYPMFSASLLFVSLKLYVFLKDVRRIALPFVFLSLNFLVDFVGDLLFNYGNSSGVAGAVVASDVFFTVGYVFSAVAFYLLCMNKKTSVSQHL